MARYITRSYECPDNGCRFDYLHTVENGVEEGPPWFCPKCGANVSGQDGADDIIPVFGFGKVGKAENQSRDNIFRHMEAASYARADEAAALVGGNPADFTHLRQTDQKDNLREGDTSFVMPTTVSAPIQHGAPPTNVTPMNAQMGAATSNMIRSQGGAVGANVMDGLKKSHSQRAAQMSRAGNMGSFGK